MVLSCEFLLEVQKLSMCFLEGNPHAVCLSILSRTKDQCFVNLDKLRLCEQDVCRGGNFLGILDFLEEEGDGSV